MLKKILLIETNKRHLEVLYPQIIFLLDSGYQVLAAVNRHAFNVDLINSLSEKVDFILQSKHESTYAFFRRLRGIIKKEAIDTLVFNTFEGSKVLIPYFVYLKKFNSIRIIHNLNYLSENKHYANRIINYLVNKIKNQAEQKMKYNFVLNRSLLNEARRLNMTNIDYFAPVFFSGFFTPKKQDRQRDDMIRIGVQGGVWFGRRNYLSLIDGLLNLDPTYRKRIKVYIVGNINTPDGKALVEAIKAHGVEDNFEYYSYFLSYSQYFNILSQMDYLATIIDRYVDDYQVYNRSKITSTVSMALALRKPMINSCDLWMEDAYKKTSLFYEETDLSSALKEAIDLSSEAYWLMVENYGQFEELDYEKQKNRYIKALTYNT